MTDSDIEELAVIGCLAAASAATYNFLLLKRRLKKNRLNLVNSNSRKRQHSVAESTSTQYLQNEIRLRSIIEYRGILHMNEDCYKKVLEYVRPQITKQTTTMRRPIPADDILSAVLTFLVTGATYIQLRNRTGISKALLSTCIPECCQAIYDTMSNDYLKFPNSIREWENIANKYLRKWHFPLCLGSLDGIHIRFKATKAYDVMYYNNEGFNSIVLLALADADCNFIFVDIGCTGNRSKAGVFNQSDFRKIIDNGINYFPANEIIAKSLPYTVIANDEFPSRKHLLTPFPYHSKNYVKRIFNLRLNHARHTIDHSFKTLVKKFGVLKTTIYLQPDKVIKIVEACCVLHNFLNQHNENYIKPLDTNKINIIKPEYKENIGINIEPCIVEIKNNFAEYFVNEGKLSWQDCCI